MPLLPSPKFLNLERNIKNMASVLQNRAANTEQTWVAPDDVWEGKILTFLYCALQLVFINGRFVTTLVGQVSLGHFSNDVCYFGKHTFCHILAQELCFSEASEPIWESLCSRLACCYLALSSLLHQWGNLLSWEKHINTNIGPISNLTVDAKCWRKWKSCKSLSFQSRATYD